MKSPTCIKCKHYYITFDKDTPMGCRHYRFISKQPPTIVVKRETGEQCMAFEQKQKKKSGAIDFNDNKYW